MFHVRRVFQCLMGLIGVVIIQAPLAQTPYFTDIAPENGMQGDFNARQLGVSWVDYNHDGLLDVFIATTPSNQLFENQGNNQFIDVAPTLGIDDPSAEAATGIWADYDSDGDLDLFVGNLSLLNINNLPVQAGINRLYQNNDGAFIDVASQAGVSGTEQNMTQGTTSASWIDYNADGNIDLLVCNRLSGVYLYQNQGDGTFLDVSIASGLRQADQESANSYEHAAWSDYDQDGDVDVFLSAGEAMMMPAETMSIQPSQMPMKPSINRLFQNQGDGHFIEVTQEAGLTYESNMARSHTAVWGDFNNDGYPDLFSGNRGSITLNTIQPSRLYQNNQDGTFSDVTESVGIITESSVFVAAWADVNNDGWLDLYIAIHPDMRDYPDHHINPTRIPHPLYVSNQDGTFTNINADLFELPHLSGMTDLGHQGGAAFGDSDQDGDLDLVVVEAMGLGPMRFYENIAAATGKHWLQVELQSNTTNRHALGAKITVQTADGNQYREVTFGSTGWGSHGPYTQHIGLGQATHATVNVTWHDQTQETFGEFSADQKIVLQQGTGMSTAVQRWSLY